MGGKDTGAFSSNANMVIRQAQKGPGPYLAHADWTPRRAIPFSKVDRNAGMKVGTDGGKIYEHKEVSTSPALAGRENLSHIKRTKFGKMGTSKKRSFLDRSIAQASALPGA